MAHVPPISASVEEPPHVGIADRRRRLRRPYEFSEGFNELESRNRRFRRVAAVCALLLAGVLALLFLQLTGILK